MSLTTAYDSKELVAGCIRQDRLCQERLYKQYKDAMYTLCKRLLNDDELAADALQEGFIEVFRSIATFREEATLGAWIKTIVLRRALKINSRYAMYEELKPNRDDRKIDWDSSLTGALLAKAIAALPAGCRQVFVLIEVEGYSHRETAALIGISEGTSKSQLFHAKKLLRDYLKPITN